MIDSNETKLFLKAINAISSCENRKQVMFMVKWVNIAIKKRKLSNDRFIRIVNSMINMRRKQI